MIRIGDDLRSSPATTDDEKKILTREAITSLSNLKNVLENTYFIKKEYWFVLRDDLLGTDGKAIQNKVFISDLQALIAHIQTS